MITTRWNLDELLAVAGASKSRADLYASLIDALGGRLDAVNENLGSLIVNGNSRSTPFPRFANASFY